MTTFIVFFSIPIFKILKVQIHRVIQIWQQQFKYLRKFPHHNLKPGFGFDVPWSFSLQIPLMNFFRYILKRTEVIHPRFFIVFCLLFLLFFIFYFDLLKASVARFSILSLLELAKWKTCNHKSFDEYRYNQIEIQA